ncbi:hypothetical protein Hanom_Chr02g00137401 [Helianthus anomalus]
MCVDCLWMNPELPEAISLWWWSQVARLAPQFTVSYRPSSSKNNTPILLQLMANGLLMFVSMEW